MSVTSCWLRNVRSKMLGYEIIRLQNKCYELLVTKCQNYDLCGNHRHNLNFKAQLRVNHQAITIGRIAQNLQFYVTFKIWSLQAIYS